MAYFSKALKNEKSGPILTCYLEAFIMGDMFVYNLNVFKAFSNLKSFFHDSEKF